MSSSDSEQENIQETVTTSSEEASLMLARIDERTRQISERMEQLETMAEEADQRSRRNQVILLGVTTAASIIFAWSLNLLPV
jgi:type II secretory pathway component PulM